MARCYEPGYRLNFTRQRFDPLYSPIERTCFNSTEFSGAETLEYLHDASILMYYKGGPDEIDIFHFKRTEAIFKGLANLAKWRKEVIK